MKIMRKIVLLWLLLLISLIVKSQTTINSEIVSGTWEKVNSPYIVSCDILVQSNTSLTIESGVEIILNGAYSLSVEGQIHANGTRTDSVLFTTSTSDITWRGLIFKSSDGTSSNISFCRIENAGSKSGSGEYTSFTNEFGGGLRISGRSSFLVTNCLIRRNKAFSGGGIYNENYNTKIINTRIEQNEAWMGSAIHSKSNSTLKGCIITGNISHIYGCLSSEMGTSLTIINNTITKNTHLDPFGGVFSISGNLTLRNTIVYFNSPARSVYNASNCKVDIRYCNIEGGTSSFKSEYSTNTLTYENNVEVRPYFADISTNDFQLIASPCVNHGDPSFSDWELSSDIAGNPRIYPSSIVDIGAYEYQAVITNFPPVAYPVEETFILKNSSCKIAIDFYDGDLTDSHTIEITSANINLKPSVFDTVKNGFIVLIQPEKDWIGDEYVYIKLRDNRNESNSLYFDSVLVHTGNRFKGIIKETKIFQDTVKIIGDVIVDTSGYLMVKEGAFIEFLDHYKISIYGRFNALGTKENRIIMNAVDTLVWYKTESYDKQLRIENGWAGIDFINTSDTIKLKYCNIFNTGVISKYNGVNSNGTINISASRNIFLEQCYFRSNFSYRETENCGIYIDSSSNIYINSCSFSDVYNHNSNGVYVNASNSKIKIDSCIFTRAFLEGQRAIIEYPKSELTINNSVFTDNNTYFLIHNTGGKKSYIENNSFINNQSNGIFTTVSDTTIIRNNMFVGNKIAIETISYAVIVGNIIAYNRLICNCSNFYGVAINMHGASGYIANNTIVSNYQDSKGDAVYLSYSSPVVVNNIFWKNRGSGVEWYNGATGFPDPIIYNNYSLDPQFVLSDSIDFNLKDVSPCINQGVDTAKYILNYITLKDIYGNSRMDTVHKKIDIGAVEFQNFPEEIIPGDTTNINPADTTGNGIYNPKLDFEIYPNPVSEYLILTELNNIHEYKIIDYRGIPVKQGLITDNKISVASLNKGVYILLLLRDRKYFVYKFIKN